MLNNPKTTHPDEIDSNSTKLLFLSQFETNPSVYSVCKRIGINRVTVYEWLEKDSEFKKRFNSVRGGHVDGIEGNLFTQALQEGKTNNITSIIFALKCWKPEVYGDRFNSVITIDHTINMAQLASDSMKELNSEYAHVIDERTVSDNNGALNGERKAQPGGLSIMLGE